MKKLGDIIHQIAKVEGTTEEQVYADMQKAIDAGFDNPDQQVQAAWKKIPLKGIRPTPEDLMVFCASNYRN